MLIHLGILQTAIKELQIEKNLNDIQQQWNSMCFQLHKHVRHANNQQEYCSIITGADDILQTLEDSTLLLNGKFNYCIQFLKFSYSF